MKIILPKIKKKKVEDDYGVFVISPLQTGYGVTIGNSLRRILLSSLAGAAVKKIKIEDVDHEFSTISGIKEDVIEIILAFKKLKVRYDSDEEIELNLKAKGPKKVSAGDISTPSDVEIINKDLHIATLQKSGELFVDIVVDKGVGYISAEERDDKDKSIGEIIIDSNYAPIEHVSYDVGQTRVGGVTDYDQLELKVTTDGAVDPESAVKQASNILVKHFDLISQMAEEVEEEIEAEVEKKKDSKTSSNKTKTSQSKKKKEKVNKKTSLEETNLSARTINVLTKNNVKTIGGLARYNTETLEEMDGLGPKSVTEIEKKLDKWGIEN